MFNSGFAIHVSVSGHSKQALSIYLSVSLFLGDSAEDYYKLKRQNSTSVPQNKVIC